MSLFSAQVVSVLEHSPACCRNCGGYERDWFLDLGYVEDFWGRYYICSVCFYQLATVARFEPIDHKAVDFLTKALEASQAKLAEYDLLFDSLRSAGFDLKSLVDNLERTRGAEESGSLSERVVEREDDSSESDHGERPDDAPIFTGSLNFG